MKPVDGVVSFSESMNPSELVAYALRLETLGYGALSLPDLFGRELFTTAGFVLGNTTRLQVATGIANVYARDAMSAAQGARTLSELYGGRFTMGLGVSHPQAADPPILHRNSRGDILSFFVYSPIYPRSHRHHV